MAEEDEGKTEAATLKRLNKAFEEGDVPFGRDALTVGNLVFALGAFASLGPPLSRALVELLRERYSTLGELPAGSADSADGLFAKVILLMISICVAAALGAVVVGIAQTRGNVWFERLAPDFTRLWSNRFSLLFSRKIFTDLGMSLVKVCVIGAAVAGMWRDRFMALPVLMTTSPNGLLAVGGAWFFPLLVRAAGAAAVLSGADLALQHWRFRQRMKMTRDEVKREGKEENGDPMIRGRRRRRMRELSRARVAVEVPRADALLVNPTHVAIAIRYRKEEGQAPRVIAKGKGKLAEIMRDLARENGIAIVEDIMLARLLYKQVKVGRQIPAETFKAVAAILAFVYRLTGKRPAKAA